MRKKNEQVGKSDKVKINKYQKDYRKVDFLNGSNMNYLILSNEQLNTIKRNIENKLQKLQKRLNQIGDSQAIRSDHIIKELQQIQKQAKNHDFGQLQKKIIFNLGKRILYLQIENKKVQLEKKKTKKQEMQQSFFRHKKIKKYDYDSLLKQKLKQKSYIVRPYSSGKGFIQSQISYSSCQQSHIQRLEQCQYLKIIKQVNKIYMKNYSQSTDQTHNKKSLFKYFNIINLVLILCCILFSLGAILLSDYQIPYAQYMLLADLAFIMIILSIIGIKAFANKPNHHNQLQQTKYDVMEYFENINSKNKKLGKKFEWICPENFMYLEVHFNQQ